MSWSKAAGAAGAGKQALAAAAAVAACSWRAGAEESMVSKEKASGFPAASCRAGAHGTWSLALAAARLLECYHKGPAKALRALRGSKGLASKVNEILTKERPGFPTDALAAGWGIGHEAMALLRKHGVSLRVRGCAGGHSSECWLLCWQKTPRLLLNTEKEEH